MWWDGEAPLLMISLRGICDQRQAGSNWRSVPDWEVKYPLPLPLACKGWGVRWERLKVGAVSVGPGGAALNRHDGEVSSVSCCPEVRARAKGGRQISDLEDSPSWRAAVGAGTQPVGWWGGT